MKKFLTRRAFLERAGKASIAGAVFYFNFISGCAPFPKEERDHVSQLEWKCNPIPMIRYVVNPKKRWWGTLPKFSTRQGFRWIYKGSSDDDIKKFGAEAAKLTKPIIIVPFQQVNDYNSELYPWAGPQSAGPFKETYVRIYDIWKQEGALENVVMALKLKVGRWEQWQYPDPLRYIPPIDKVDIIGWCVNNHCQPHRNTPSLSFKKLFKSTYSRTVAKYNNTPQFIWELACNSRC